MWIGHRKEIRMLTFWAFIFSSSLEHLNVSFQISLQWSIHIINPVNKSKWSPDLTIWAQGLVGDIVLLRYSPNASLHPGFQMGSNEFHAGGNPAMDWHRNDPMGVEYSKLFHATSENGISMWRATRHV